MTPELSSPTLILVPGHWLGAWAWDEVTEHLRAAGRTTVPLTLPGLDAADPDRESRTLDDQAAALEHTVKASSEPVLVAHSGANGPVTLLLDRLPELIRRVIWVDSGPVAPGTAFAPGYPEGAPALPLPEFDALGEQASLAGLTPESLARFRAHAVAEPGGVLRQPVRLTNDARYDVRTSFICCSIPSDKVRELASARHPMFSEVSKYRNTDYVDLETGHWPMWSRPADLASIIDAALGS